LTFITTKKFSFLQKALTSIVFLQRRKMLLSAKDNNAREAFCGIEIIPGKGVYKRCRCRQGT